MSVYVRVCDRKGEAWPSINHKVNTLNAVVISCQSVTDSCQELPHERLELYGSGVMQPRMVLRQNKRSYCLQALSLSLGAPLSTASATVKSGLFPSYGAFRDQVLLCTRAMEEPIASSLPLVQCLLGLLSCHSY